MIQLWPFEGPTTPTPVDPPQITGRTEHFILDFSPSERSAAISRGKSNTVAIIDLKDGGQRLTIEAGMEVYGLRIVDDTVVVEGSNKLVTWKLPVEDPGPGAVVRVEDSVRTTEFHIPRPNRPQSASISPDLLQIAIRGEVFGASSSTAPLYIYDVRTGDFLAKTPAAGDMAWFSRDRNQVWCDGEAKKEQGWEVKRGDGPPRASLNPLRIGDIPEGYP